MARSLVAGELLPWRPQALSRAAHKAPWQRSLWLPASSAAKPATWAALSESPGCTRGDTWCTASLVIHEGCGLPRFIRVRPMLLAFTVFRVMCSLAQHKPVMMMKMVIIY